jgi:hypothetical protein
MSAARETTDFSAAVTRLRELADASADAMVTEGTVSPDHALLDLCADIGKQRQIETEASRAAYPNRFAYPGEAERPEQDRLRAISATEHRSLAHMLRAASKLKATTPAGIFAKALAIRSSKTGTNGLAISLAEDLTDNPMLRSLLWPAEVSP